MIRHRIALAALWAVAFQPVLLLAQNASPGPAEKTTAAVLDLERSTVGPLLQDLLARNAQVTWVDRDSLNAVLNEQALQEAFGAAGGRDRVQLGKLLKADVLVLLRTVELPAPPEATKKPEAPGAPKKPPVRQLDIVVSETAQGLRLARASVPLSDDPKADALALEPVVARALKKRRERVTTVCAVPAFVSTDLLYEFDYLKMALPKVIEASLLDQPGVLLVELAEAQSLAREISLAGRPALERPLPLFLLGEYRNSGRDANRSLSISLRLMRGDTEVAVESTANLPPADLSSFLVRTSGALLAKVEGHALLPADPIAEAQQLAQRARAQMLLGSWDEAMPLVEASLLLEPGRTEALRDAVIISAPLASRFIPRSTAAAVVEKSLRDYRRGLEHIETFMRQVPDMKPYMVPGKNMTIVDQFPFFFLPRKTPPPDTAGLYAEVLQAHRETLLRLTRLRAVNLSQDPAIVASDGSVPGVRYRLGNLPAGKGLPLNLELAAIGGETDDYRFLWFAVDRLPDRQRFDTIRNVIDDLQDLPGFRGRAYRFARGCYQVRVFDTAEGRDFLARLCSDPRPEVQSAGTRISKELDEELSLPKRWAPAPEYASGAPGEPKLPAASVQVVLRPIEPKYTQDDGQIVALKALEGCEQVDANTDVLWINNHLLEMREKGKARLVASFKPRHCRVASPSFDGRYLWFVVQGAPAENPVLMVMDHKQEKISQLTVENGLPLPKLQTGAKGNVRQWLRVVAVEPGKACLSGYFGHSWIAMVTFDPLRKEEFDIKIFLQALEEADPTKPEQAMRKDVAFTPGLMSLVEGSLPGQGPGKRVVVPRRSTNEALYEHPLLVDPETLNVQVIDEAYPHHYAPQMPPAAHDGALYSIMASPNYKPMDIRLCRFGFPTLTKEVLFHDMPQGRVVFTGDRVHIVGKKWWVGSLTDGKFAVAAEKLPWYFTNGWTYPGQEPKANGSDLPVGIFRSAHYGLIISARRSDAALMAVDFIPRLGAAE